MLCSYLAVLFGVPGENNYKEIYSQAIVQGNTVTCLCTACTYKFSWLLTHEQCFWSCCVYLQKSSYFTAKQYPPPGDATYLIFQKGSSLAFRYVNKVVKLENYDQRGPHTTASFLFKFVPVHNGKFSDDCVCTKHNKGHLLVTVLVLTMALVIVHTYATAI